MENSYRKILQLSPDQIIPLQTVESPREFLFPFKVKHLFGRNYRFRGSGFNFNVDRIYIREKLRELVTVYGDYIKKLLVKLPSSLLQGNREIIELSSSIEVPSNRLVNTVDGTNLILVAMDERGLTSSLQQFLRNNFISNLLKNQEQHKIVFLELTELAYGIQTIPQLFDPNLRTKSETFKQNLFQTFRQILELQSPNYYCNLDQILNTTTFFSIKPRLFSFFHKNRLAPSTFIETYTVTEAISASFIPALIGSITNMALTQCAISLKEINRSWMKKCNQDDSKSGIQDRTIKLLNILSNESKNSKQHGEIVQNLEQLTISFQHEFSSWKENLHQEFQRVMASILQYCSLNNFLESMEIEKTNLSILFHQNDLLLLQVVHNISSVWNDFITQFIRKQSELLLTICSSLLEKCVLISVGRALTEIPPCKLSQFCTSTHQRAHTRLDQFYRSFQLNISSIVKSIYEQTISQNQFGQLFFQQVAVTLQQKLIEKYTVEISQLEALSKDFQRAIRMILVLTTTSHQYQTEQFKKVEDLSSPPQLDEEMKKISLASKNDQNLDEMETLEIGLKPSKLKFFIFNFFFKKKAKEYKFDPPGEMIDIKTDENSQFRALSYLIYETEEAHSICRLLVMNEILSAPEYYSKFIEAKGMEVQEYVFSMAQNDQPGDSITLFAFCNSYDVDLLLHSSNRLHPILIQPRNARATRSFSLVLLRNNIYKPLVLKSNLNKSDESSDSSSKFAFPIKNFYLSGTLSPLRGNQPIYEENHYAAQDQLVKSRKNGVASVQLFTPKSLTDLCITAIGSYMNIMPNLAILLPEELAYKILRYLITNQSLTSSILQKFLHPSINSLDLSQWVPLTDYLFTIVAQKSNNLKELSLSACVNIGTSSIEQIAAHCPELEILDISDCIKLEDSAVQEIARRCSRLVSINLNNCVRTTDQSLVDFFQFSSTLERLSVRNCINITDNAFLAVSTFPIPVNLRHLDLIGCDRLTDAAVLTISKLWPHLSVFKISSRNITDHSIVELVHRCVEFVVIDLSGCELITDLSVQGIMKNCSMLQELTLSGCRNITDNAFLSTYSVLDLHKLNLSRCLYISDVAVNCIIKNSPNLIDINLGFCGSITDNSISLFPSRSPNLVELNLSKCTGLTGTVLSYLVTQIPHLIKLNLYNCVQALTQESALALALNCTKLRCMDLSSCSSLTDDLLKTLVWGCPFLEELALEDCSLVGEIGIEAISLNCYSLKNLKLAYVKGVTNSTLFKLSQGCQYVTNLDLSYCPNISVEGIQSALNNWFYLTVLNCRGLHQLTTQGFHSPSLLELNLSWCRNLQDSFIDHLCNSNNMAHLDISWAVQITSSSVHRLLQNLPNLRSLNLRGCSKVTTFISSRILPSLGDTIIYS